VAEGEKLAELAQRSGLVLMCGHTYCYTPAVQRIRQLIRGGEIGDIQFVDSVRINLGLAEEFPTGEQHHPYANDTLYGRRQ
jgi:predicted dehydrogenase